MSINENIKEARKAIGLTQKDLADMIDVSQKDISRWETGARTPSVEGLIKICKALNVSADKLLGLKDLWLLFLFEIYILGLYKDKIDGFFFFFFVLSNRL